jgi:PAS domain S-box-containing protein
MTESLLRAAFDSTADGILVVGRDGEVIEVNGRFAELWRVPSDVLATGSDHRLLQHVLEQLVDPAAFAREVSRLYASDEELADSIAFRDGRVFERYSRPLVVRGERARLWSFRDVTAQREAELALQRERQRLRAFVRAIPDLVWLKDPEGRYLACNEGFERLYGAPEAEIVGRRDEDFVDPELAAFFRGKDREAALLGRANVNEEWLTFKSDGRCGLFETIKTPVHDADGAFVGVLGVARDFTSRNQLDSALRESEASFRAIFDGVSDGIFLHDAETGDIVRVNARVAQMYGYRAAEMVGMDANALSLGEAPYDGAAAHALIGRTLAGETPTSEWVARRRDGATFWVEVSPRLVEIAGKRRVAVLVRDIGDRKRAEDQVKRSQHTLQLALDAAGLGTWRHDVRSGRMHLDETARAHFGFGTDVADVTFEEAVARTHPDDLPKVLASITSALEKPLGGPANIFECRVVHPDGQVRWLAVHGQTAFEENGGERLPHVTIGTTHDITERKRAEDTLRRIVSGSPAMIYALAPSPAGLELAWVSDNVEAITGFTQPEARSPGWWRAHAHPADSERIRSLPLPRGLERQAFEYRFRRKDGRYVWIRDERKRSRGGAAGEGDDGAGDEIVGSWSDVTARVELEEQLRASQKLEAIGRLAGGIAHDFNNLLTVIGGNCEFLASELATGSDARALLDEIRDASARAAALTRQLLAFSRSQVLAPQVVDLNEVVTRVEGMLRRLLGEDIRITTRLAPDLDCVRVDPVQIEQVLLNLALNARDAMPGGGALTIETHEFELDEGFVLRHPDASPGRHALLRVVDTGAGMTPEVKARVFEPFFTTKPLGKGTGLGLATVFGVVKQSHGHIQVESEPGRGARFDIYLPAIGGEAERDAERDAASASTRDPRHGSETILLAEDEPGVRRLARGARAARLSRAGGRERAARARGRRGVRRADPAARDRRGHAGARRRSAGAQARGAQAGTEGPVHQRLRRRRHHPPRRPGGQRRVARQAVHGARPGAQGPQRARRGVAASSSGAGTLESP